MADGGGLGAAVLTADLVARAVIAAARSYGDDPVQAMTSRKRGPGRRCLTAAASGLQRGTDLPGRRCCRVLGLHFNTLPVARARPGTGFLAAETAAMRAVEYALWQPDAAESVAGAQDEDEADAPAAEICVPAAFDEAMLPEDPAEGAAEVVAEAPSTAFRGPPPPTGEEWDGVRPGPLSVRGGAISSGLMPAFNVPAKVTASSPTRDRLLAVLAEGPGCTQGLATILDVKELLISETLRVLQHEGLVVAGEMPPEGRRQQRWRLVEACA